MRHNQRSILRLILLCLAVLVFPALAAQAAPSEGALSGSVTKLQGPATLETQGASRAVALGEPVRVGDILRTGAKARLELTMIDGSGIILSEDTTFTVETFSPPSGSARFSLGQGAFRAVTGAIVSGSTPVFEVRTPIAVIGIRGTDFWGGFFAADELAVFMVSGKGLVVSNAAGSQLITQPGQGITVRSATAAPEPAVLWKQPKIDRAIQTVTFGGR